MMHAFPISVMPKCAKFSPYFPRRISYGGSFLQMYLQYPRQHQSISIYCGDNMLLKSPFSVCVAKLNHSGTTLKKNIIYVPAIRLDSGMIEISTASLLVA